MTKAVPREAMGLWRREVITAPGFRDETTQVFWLQTSRWYADLRVRADRPGPGDGDGLAGYGDEALVALAETQGFAGTLDVAGEIYFWRRDFDIQPAGPLPDEARCWFQGEALVEDGIHAEYQEIWRRAPGAEGPFAAFSLEAQDGRGGLLVVAGAHMIEFLARPGPKPEGESLAALVADALSEGRRDAAEALLGTRVRYAVLSEGGWTTVLSSAPWLEERPMWASGAMRFDPGAGVLEAEAPGGRVTATLLGATATPEEIVHLLEGRIANAAVREASP